MLKNSHLSFITRCSFGIENRDEKVWTDKYFLGIAAPVWSMTQPLQTFGNKCLSCVDWISPIANQRPRNGGCQSKEFISCRCCRNSTLYYAAITVPFLLCLGLSMRYRKDPCSCLAFTTFRQFALFTKRHRHTEILSVDNISIWIRCNFGQKRPTR